MATSPKHSISVPPAPRHALLGSIEAAFARGDGRSGELLIQQALDSGLAWDAVTGAAARGVSLRFAPAAGRQPA